MNGIKDISELSQSNLSEKLEHGFRPNFFDRIILDAPCSGLGQRPIFNLSSDLLSISHLLSFAHQQKRLLKVASQLLKPGGKLVYSVCSIQPEEGEGVIAYGIQECGLNLEDIGKNIKDVGGCPGVKDYGLNESNRNKIRRFEPGSTWDGIGFFLAIFTKLEK